MGSVKKYIQEQLRAGFSAGQIESHLLSEGYSQSEITSLFKKIQDEEYQTNLFAYIQEQKKAGISKKELVNQLISQGHQPALVTKLVLDNHHYHMIFFLLLIAGALLVSSFFFLFPASDSSFQEIPQPEPVIEELSCIQSDPVERDTCLFYLAQDDPALCQDISSLEIRDDCFFLHTDDCSLLQLLENQVLCEQEEF